jgi:hypothetical protein
MSYGGHIIRVPGDTLAITLAESLAYVSSDSEMHFKGNVEIVSPKGDAIEWNAPGLAEWTDPQTGTKAYFDHKRSGKVSVGNPSQTTLIKMFRIAKTLGCVVSGDDGECCNVATPLGDQSREVSDKLASVAEYF